MLLYNIRKISLTAKLLVLIASAPIVLVYFLAYTATGLSWMLNSSVDDPTASVSIASVSNEIVGSTTLRHLRYKSEFADITFERVTLQWNPLSIFTSQVVVENLSGENLSVDFKSEASGNTLLAKLDFPKATNVVAASIDGLDIKSNGKTIYKVSNAAIDNIYLDDSFFADKITLKSPNGQWVKLSGQFGFSANSVINLTTESLLEIPSKNTSIRAKGTLVGNAAQLRFLQHVSSPFSADINGRIKHLFTDPSWVLDTKLSAVDLSVLTEGKFLKNMSGELSVNGHWKKSEINSDLLLKDKANNSWVAKFVAITNSNMLSFELDIKAAMPSAVTRNSHANFIGTYDLDSLAGSSEQVQGLKVKGNWAGFSIPLNNNNTILAKSGSVNFDGSTYMSQVKAEGIQLNTLGPTLTRLVLNTQKDGNGEVIFNGVATSPDGKLNLSGSMVRINNNFELDNLFLSGKNFTLMRKPSAHIIVSPNLSFVRRNNIMTSTGSVNVPTANIQLQDFKKTLSVISSMIDSKNHSVVSTGYVDVKFGKSVWLHGFGLNAHVTGDLSLRNMSNKRLVANGELNVLRGNYRKLNQEHALSGGRLKFNNHNLDNPELDLKMKMRGSEADFSNKIMGRLQKLFNESKRAAKEKISAKNTTNLPDLKKVAFYVGH
ncbi:translocation/assembly module TamB domain-containing protein [Kaarinaea lacus]